MDKPQRVVIPPGVTVTLVTECGDYTVEAAAVEKAHTFPDHAESSIRSAAGAHISTEGSWFPTSERGAWVGPLLDWLTHRVEILDFAGAQIPDKLRRLLETGEPYEPTPEPDFIRSIHPGRCRCGKRISQDSQSCTWHTSVQANAISDIAAALIADSDPAIALRRAVEAVEKDRH